MISQPLKLAMASYTCLTSGLNEVFHELCVTSKDMLVCSEPLWPTQRASVDFIMWDKPPKLHIVVWGLSAVVVVLCPWSTVRDE